MSEIDAWIVCPNHAAQRWPVYRDAVGGTGARKGIFTHRIGPRPGHEEEPLQKPRCPECGTGLAREET